MSESHAEHQGAVGSDPFPAISQRRRRGVRVTSAAALALGLIVSGGAVAGAATPPSPPTGSPRPAAPCGQQPFDAARPIAVGTVRTIGDSSFTMTAQDGTTVTVQVDRSTMYLDPGVTSPTIASVTVGEQVAVFGTEASGLGDRDPCGRRHPTGWWPRWTRRRLGRARKEFGRRPRVESQR